jgi:hypothetical protein
MREHKQSRIILSLLLGLLLLACLPVCAFADTTELSDGDEAGISLSTKVPPSVVSGDGAAYTKGGASSLNFTTDDAKGNLLRVLVDGKAVSPKNYTVSGDPLSVTLHPDFLDTLSAGEHTIEIVTVNGTARANFTIHKETQHESQDHSEDHTQERSLTSPATGDNSHTVLWTILMMASLVALIILVRTGKHIPK